MMNKVARYRGIAKNDKITCEPGYIYLADDGLYVVDELRQVHKFAAGESVDGEISDAVNQSESLETRIALLEDKVRSLSKANIEPAESTAGEPIIANDSTKDYVITGEATTSNSLTAKSVELKSFQMDVPSGSALKSGNAMLIDAKDDVDISGSEIAMHQQTSSNCVKITGVKSLTIRDTTFSGETYNTIMTGQNTTEFLKYLVIENCDFSEDCKHVNIWIGGYQDGAVIDIRDCHFKTCEQVLCISDFHDSPSNTIIINLTNVTIDNYEQNDAAQPDYNGFILLDSRKCAAGEVEEKNPFGAGKMVINMKNVNAGGVLIDEGNFVMGRSGNGQMLYYYVASERRNIEYGDGSMFPTVTFK